jgi:hypothetical protein
MLQFLAPFLGMMGGAGGAAAAGGAAGALGGLGGTLGTLGQLAGPVGSILSIFGGGGNKAGPPPMSEAERYSISLLKALGQPNNSYVKSMEDAEFKNLREGVLSDINEKVLADRREGLMGRSPVFFDPERRDENIYSQITRGTPALQQMARSNAVSRILSAAGVGNFAGAQDKRISSGLNAQAAQKEASLSQGGLGGMLGQGGNALSQIMKILQGNTSQTGSGSVIYWD